MGKIIRLLLVVVLCFSLSGCDLEEIKQKLGLSKEKSEVLVLGNNLLLDFGTVAVGAEALKEYAFHGVALLGYEIVKFSVDEGQSVFAVTRKACSEPGGDSDDVCAVTFVFHPSDALEYRGRVSVWGKSITGESKGNDLSKLGEIVLHGIGGKSVLFASPLAYDWGKLAVRTGGAFEGPEVSISVRSGASTRIGRIHMEDGGFVITDNGCAGGVDLSEGCVIKVKPDVHKEGDYTATLWIEAEDRFIAPVGVSLRAKAEYAPGVEVSPKAIEWRATIEDGKSVVTRESVSIANTGFAAFSVKAAKVEVEAAASGAVPVFSVSNRCQNVLAGGESCELVVSGTFTEAGIYDAVLVIGFDVLKTAYVPISVRIEKSGTQPPDNNTRTGDAISVDPPSYVFPDVRVKESAQATFSVTNKTDLGLALLWRIDSRFDGSSGTPDNMTIPAFKMASTCYQIEPQKTCQVTMVFAPATSGEYNAHVIIEAHAGTDLVGTATMTLKGNGVAAQAQSAPAGEFDMVVRYAIPLDRWSRAPTEVYVVVDLASAQAAALYQGTTFYVDGAEALQSSTMTGAVPVDTAGEHVITAVGRTSDGRSGRAYATVVLVEGDAPQCRIEQYGDGVSSLSLKAVCSVQMGYIVDYDWVVDGREFPVDGSIIGFARNDLDSGIQCVEMTASTDKGQKSTVRWGC